jgi:hypothetical protein
MASYQQGAMIEWTLRRQFHSLAELDYCEVPEAVGVQGCVGLSRRSDGGGFKRKALGKATAP